MKFVRDSKIRLTALEGEGIVLHLDERKYFSINETGLVLLEALKEPKTLEQLVTALEDEYDVGRDDAVRTTREFLDKCLAANVVQAQDE